MNSRPYPAGKLILRSCDGAADSDSRSNQALSGRAGAFRHGCSKVLHQSYPGARLWRLTVLLTADRLRLAFPVAAEKLSGQEVKTKASWPPG